MNRVNTNWIGKPLPDMLNNSSPKQIIVLLNNTEAPTDMHIHNSISTLKSMATLEDLPANDKESPPFFDCIVILENGGAVRVERQRAWTRITTTECRGYITGMK